ncbi:N-acetylmuramoyl-L-alanine amidase family protein [Paenibacillus endoradicis]|uniref:N-acetylmuramoyl-L-alanine amidase family protein n=1 Tax=Paenibacillus endoradicis TaxID=2972487 RepID=UPI00215950F7|nr:N-acetylmuramoyl-L-alanine amidase [Paenibacillus endoradicis]MCR8655892.1 N-acetylmuramoyl-L-alanine amidase [Paenibacillus endoradicis]MCR8658218.1 N-acetylmuramoyl-L-alanine amidase [Paenibacillus endoradicis]
MKNHCLLLSIAICLLIVIISCSPNTIQASSVIWSTDTNEDAASLHYVDAELSRLTNIDGAYTEIMFPTTAVIIDAGHGGIDGGASYQNILEKDINLAVAKKLYAILQSNGIPTILNRTGDYALSEDNDWHKTSSRHLKDLSQRMGLTREIEHVIFISLHVNAAPNARANGPLVLHQHTGESSLLANNIQAPMNELFGTSKHVVPVKTFYLLKYIKSPAVLVELGFISNAADRERLVTSNEQTKIASAIASGVLHYLWIN